MNSKNSYLKIPSSSDVSVSRFNVEVILVEFFFDFTSILELQKRFHIEMTKEEIIEFLFIFLYDYDSTNNFISLDFDFIEFMSDNKIEEDRNLLWSLYVEYKGYLVQLSNLLSRMKIDTRKYSYNGLLDETTYIFYEIVNNDYF